MSEWLSCIACHRRFDIGEIRYTCDCGGLLSVERDALPKDTKLFDERRAKNDSGVWRFREGVLSVPENQIVSH